MKSIITAVLASILLAGCSASIQDYEDMKPELHLDEFFQGDIVAHGMVLNRQGKVTRRFKADIDASWEGNLGTLDEVFYWDDGSEETRIWEIVKNGPNSYSGTAGDVVGTAEGITAGNALHWVYQLEVPFRDGEIKVTLDDWMYLLDENRLMNRTEMKKFGFRVGEIIIYMEKK